MNVAMDFEGSGNCKSFGHVFARSLLIGVKAEGVTLNVNLVNELIVVRESQAFATANAHFARMKFATFLYNGVGTVGAKCRTTNQKEQKHQFLHLVVAKVWSPLVFSLKAGLERQIGAMLVVFDHDIAEIDVSHSER